VDRPSPYPTCASRVRGRKFRRGAASLVAAGCVLGGAFVFTGDLVGDLTSREGARTGERVGDEGVTAALTRTTRAPIGLLADKLSAGAGRI
jgi:hypothetical protein